MEVINGRTLELLRRLQGGEIVDAIREHGNSPDDRFIKNFTSPNGKHVLASWIWPSVNEQKARNMARNDGTAPLEPYCRLSQYIMEPLLMKFCEAEPLINLCIGERFLGFQETADKVVSAFQNIETGAESEVTSSFLVGCEGAMSVVRQQLNIGMTGPGRLHREGKGLLLLHFRDVDGVIAKRWGKFWHQVRSSSRGNMYIISQQHEERVYTVHLSGALSKLIAGDDKRHFDDESEEAASVFLGHAFNADHSPLKIELLVRSMWSPSLLVADSYGNGLDGGRVLLAGDSVHAVIPTGGYGMNSGTGDAMELGWKICARVRGWGGDCLLPSYEVERRHVMIRNRTESERHSTQVGSSRSSAVIDQDSHSI
jgi:2-polyprenyl-6-methoxyphenol hydroxylase-like FAD-dependent oxidoreductase